MGNIDNEKRRAKSLVGNDRMDRDNRLLKVKGNKKSTSEDGITLLDLHVEIDQSSDIHSNSASTSSIDSSRSDYDTKESRSTARADDVRVLQAERSKSLPVWECDNEGKNSIRRHSDNSQIRCTSLNMGSTSRRMSKNCRGKLRRSVSKADSNQYHQRNESLNLNKQPKNDVDQNCRNDNKLEKTNPDSLTKAKNVQDEVRPTKGKDKNHSCSMNNHDLAESRSQSTGRLLRQPLRSRSERISRPLRSKSPNHNSCKFKKNITRDPAFDDMDQKNDQEASSQTDGGSNNRCLSETKKSTKSSSVNTNNLELKETTATKKNSFRTDSQRRSDTSRRMLLECSDQSQSTIQFDVKSQRKLIRSKSMRSKSIDTIYKKREQNSIDTTLPSNTLARSNSCRVDQGLSIKSSDAVVKESIKKKFLDMIDFNPSQTVVWSSETSKVLIQLMKKYPTLCSTTYYCFRAFPKEPILPIHMLCALGAPVAIVQQCLRSYPEALHDNETSNLGTPFHFVCMFHHYHKSSRNEQEQLANTDEKTDSTMSVTTNNSLVLLKYLVKTKASGLTVQNKLNGKTPLHLACMAHHHEVRSYGSLGSGSSRDTYSKNETIADATEDFDGLCDRYSAIVNYILQVCPKLVIVLDKEQNSPLHVACATAQNPTTITTAITSKLMTASIGLTYENTIAHCCASQNMYGATPLHLALYNKVSNELIEKLIHANASALRIEDNKLRLPIHIAVAVKNQDTSLYQLLVLHYPESVKHKSKNSETAQQMAINKGLDSSIVKILSLHSNHKVHSSNIVRTIVAKTKTKNQS